MSNVALLPLIQAVGSVGLGEGLAFSFSFTAADGATPLPLTGIAFTLAVNDLAGVNVFVGSTANGFLEISGDASATLSCAISHDVVGTWPAGGYRMTLIASDGTATKGVFVESLLVVGPAQIWSLTTVMPSGSTLTGVAMNPPIVVVSSSQTVSKAAIYIVTVAGVTLTLNPPSSVNGAITIKDVTGNADPNIEIIGAIDGADNLTFHTAFQSVSLQPLASRNIWGNVANAPASANAPSVPLPFMGNAPASGWSRPSASDFTVLLNATTGIALASDNDLGSGYAPGDISTLAGGTGVPGRILITATGLAGIPSIVNAGHSGTPGSAQVKGTTGLPGGDDAFVLDVTIGVGGSIASIDDVSSFGQYTTNPTLLSSEPVADASASGLTGAIVNLTGLMGVVVGAVDFPGDYSVAPSNPVSEASSSGAGVGATWNLTFGSIPLSVSDLPGGLPLLVSAPVQSTVGFSKLVGLLKPIGSPPWTITSAVVAITNWRAPLASWAPIILYNVATGAAVALTWYQSGEIVVSHFNSATTPSGAPTVVSNVNTGALISSYFMWFRAVNDGTNISFQFSLEGQDWLEVYTESATALLASVDYVGFGEDLYGSAETTNPSLGSIPGAAVQNVGLWQWAED